MTGAQRTTLLTDPSLAAVTELKSYQQAIEKLFRQPGQPVVTSLPAGFTFPAAITGTPHHIPIRYEPVLRFTGLMTAAQRTTLLTDPSLAAVTGIAAYQEAIEEFFTRPRLALKFFEPVFTAPLANLPAAVDFKALPDRCPRLRRSPTTPSSACCALRASCRQEKKRRSTLCPLTAAYRNAVNSLATQPAHRSARRAHLAAGRRPDNSRCAI